MKLLRIALSATLLLAASISFAQTKEGDIVINIPFAFTVAGSTLPPGHYIVTRLNNNLGIHDRENRGLFAPTHSAQRPAHENTTKIVFHRYGDTYFLSEVWASGDSLGRVLFPSRAERELAESNKEREVAVVRLGR
jgi:hypothetical protein